jgi:hypothetical protein
MAEVQISKKVTVGSLGLNRAQLQALVAGWAEGQEADVATIYGNAAKVERKPNKEDPSKTDVRFVGMFEGVNLMTGETIVAGSTFLPSAVSGMLEAAVDNASQGVEFSCLISVKKVEKSITGYVFTVRMARDPETVDPLAELRQKAVALAGQITAPALPAPKRGRPAKAATEE